MINEMIGHFEGKNGNRFENKEVLKKYEEVWEGIKKKLKPLMVAKKLNMEKILKKLGLSPMMICHYINL